MISNTITYHGGKMRKVRCQDEIRDDGVRGSKVCSICGERKPFGAYYSDKGNVDGLMAKCSDCCSRSAKNRRVRKGKQANNRYDRASNLMRKYGITLEDYDNIFAKQEGKCAICGSEDSGSRKSPHFHVDHCHKTGVIRGLLCSHCNIGLGHFSDNTKRLAAAIDYIGRIVDVLERD